MSVAMLVEEPLTLNEMKRELDDLRLIVDMMLSPEDAKDVVVAGGYARRFHMKENGIAFKPQDDIKSDIDVFLPFSLLPRIDSEMTDTEESYAVGNLLIKDHPQNADATTLHVGFALLWRRLVEQIYRNFKSPRKFQLLYQSVKTDFKSLRFNYIRLEMENLLSASKPTDEALNHIEDYRPSLMSLYHRTSVLPVLDMLQFVFSPYDDVVEAVTEKFDMDNAKFILRYPFTTVEYVGEHELDDIYHIREINTTPLQILKMIRRMEKYTGYGFTYSSKCYETMVELAEDDSIDLTKILCYCDGGIYD